MKGSKRKDAILLAVVAVIGIGGLLLLQIARNRQMLNSDQRAVVQNSDGETPRAEGAQSVLQSVSTNLLRINDQPEVGIPFHYELADFSQGGTYQLDPGDGSPRQNFVNGHLTYTYQKPGTFYIGIYAIDGDKQYKIITVPKQVGNFTENKVVNKKTKSASFDD